MLKHKIAYTDFNGMEREEDFYFHLSVPEVTRLEAELGTDLGTYAQTIASNQDVDKLLAFLEKIVLTSYGKKTSDGKSFYKSPELRTEFEYSQAYAELFQELITNPELAQKFGEKVAEQVGKKAANPATLNIQK